MGWIGVSHSECLIVLPIIISSIIILLIIYHSSEV